MVRYEWRGTFHSHEVEVLHAEGFMRERSFTWDWLGQVDRHSLGWVCARQNAALVGWVNVAWDGGVHAFLLDTLVASSHRRRGIAVQLVGHAVNAARAAECEWLHVDFGPQLRDFYWAACGFTPTDAGVIRL